jgi:hypothetical protein
MWTSGAQARQTHHLRHSQFDMGIHAALERVNGQQILTFPISKINCDCAFDDRYPRIDLLLVNRSPRGSVRDASATSKPIACISGWHCPDVGNLSPALMEAPLRAGYFGGPIIQSPRCTTCALAERVPGRVASPVRCYLHSAHHHPNLLQNVATDYKFTEALSDAASDISSKRLMCFASFSLPEGLMTRLPAGARSQLSPPRVVAPSADLGPALDQNQSDYLAASRPLLLTCRISAVRIFLLMADLRKAILGLSQRFRLVKAQICWESGPTG